MLKNKTYERESNNILNKIDWLKCTVLNNTWEVLNIDFFKPKELTF